MKDWPNLDLPEYYAKPENALEVVLVFGYNDRVPRLKPSHVWEGFHHQHGGYSCNHSHLIATRLKLRPEIYASLRSIAREGYGADGGRFDCSDLRASRLAWYYDALKNLELTCETRWRPLSEAFYPLDPTQSNLSRLTADGSDIQDFVLEKDHLHDAAFYLLTQNSD